MPNNQITSLHSPHVERVKALLGSRGKKIRQTEKEFIADGIQSVREVLSASLVDAPELINLYVTEKGFAKLQEEISREVLEGAPIVHVSDAVMNEMAETESPQGILALCKFTQITLYKIKQREAKKIAYFWEIQDPGNSGTVIRTAEALGFDAVVFSKNSVDVYSPKTVRATVGALWHIPVVESVDVEELMDFATAGDFYTVALAGDGSGSITDLPTNEKTILIFGNEARGLPEIAGVNARVAIPMKGKSESLNVASAAAIAMFEVGIR
ncbi:MAG: RNA methyltransferase [Actinobacteria bacterium]|nr:RNA methyltransferase [Actinomycetota bacterium]